MNKKIAVCSIMILGLSLMATSCYFPRVEATEQQTTTFPLSGPLSLEVVSDNGDITIHGTVASQEVRVIATLRAWGQTSTDAKSRLRAINVEMLQQGSKVILRHIPTPAFGIGFFKSDQVAFEVWIPTNADVDLQTDNGNISTEAITGNILAQTDNGDQTHQSITGTFDLKTDNGTIDVMEGNGSLMASSDNGNVYYSGHLVGPQHRVTTDNGDIRLTIPKESALHIEARVDNGSIRSRLPVVGEMKSRHWDVVLNAPDAMLTLSSDNGTISIEELR